MAFPPRQARVAVAAIAIGVSIVAACGPASAGASPGSATTVLRLGYFPNLTHATAIVGVADGLFAGALGPDVALETRTFNAGTEAVEALFSGALDASYVGPNPAINAWARSKGEAVRIVAGATSGGAFLVTRPGITDPSQLRGRTLATPALGNTQDVALRSWLETQGLSTTAEGGGDVAIRPQSNADTLAAFASGAIDGAWVPEPWATRMVREGGGRVLVDERDLWPGGRYVTTELIVSSVFLGAHPDAVAALLRGHVAATARIGDDPDRSRRTVAAEIGRLTGSTLPDDLLAAAWRNLTFTNDPIAGSLQASADHAVAFGLLEPVDLTGIYDLEPLNAALSAAGQPAVPAP
ncbi:MAG TPA: ABC transporter substrate-binding protein [Candidatus Limnocylindrales bacterium]|nr:ABC transporter substrate-binding protein [Candidatus Limnocylindrales bacterium]